MTGLPAVRRHAAVACGENTERLGPGEIFDFESPQPAARTASAAAQPDGDALLG
jgi:hypothetical protein